MLVWCQVSVVAIVVVVVAVAVIFIICIPRFAFSLFPLSSRTDLFPIAKQYHIFDAWSGGEVVSPTKGRSYKRGDTLRCQIRMSPVAPCDIVCNFTACQ
jgi:hypothetical protein